MHVPIFFGGIEREMGLEKAYRKKKGLGLLPQPFELVDGQLCELAIRISIICHLRLFGRLALGGASRFLETIRCPSWLLKDFGFGPRNRIQLTSIATENLSQRYCSVAMVLKILWQGQEVWLVITKPVSIVPNPNMIRQTTGHHRSPGRPTDSLIAVGLLKETATRGETIHVWGLCQRIAITAHCRSQIIHPNQKNIGA